MRKLLNVISATALVGTAGLTVVSCSTNKNYEQFKGWIDNKESFILYLGADDCPYCQTFETTEEVYATLYTSKLSELNAGYAQTISALDTSNGSDSLTAFGETLGNAIDIRTMKTEEVANKFTEKWSANILSWIIDEMTSIYKAKYFANTGLSDTLATHMAKTDVESYFTASNVGIPFFLVIRNGKMVGWEIGFGSTPTGGWNELLVDDLFDTFTTILNNPEQEDVMAKVIADNKSGSSSGDDTTTTTLKTNPTFNFEMNDPSLINSYRNS